MKTIYKINQLYILPCLMIVFSGDVSVQMRNYWNILFVSDHSENLGYFWYIFVEV